MMMTNDDDDDGDGNDDALPGGSILDEMEIDKIGHEGRSVCHLSGSGFRSASTVLGKKHVELFLGLFPLLRPIHH